LKVFNIRTYYTDDWGSYSKLIPKDQACHRQAEHPKDRRQKPFVAHTDQAIGAKNNLLFKVGSAS
jgi:IS1 family transposase